MAKFLHKLFQSKYDNPNPKSTEFEINNWELSELLINKVVPHSGWHPFPLNELMLMGGAVARFRPEIIFEWGTHIGKSARIFYEVSEGLGLKPTIHSIDLPNEAEHVEHPHEQRGILAKGIRRVRLHEGDGIDTALSILKKWDKSGRKSNKALFFIDGDHNYESVKRELSAITENASEAPILLHDSFYQSPDSKYNVGVHKAIKECLKKSRYRRIDTATGLPGMTLLYK
ncbi:MAG: class I SAM-dependent methyltransferase [Candidatus Saccharimonadales bacterium]